MGRLVAAVVSPEEFSGISGLTRPMSIGRAGMIEPVTKGTLFFKINESANELGNNIGRLKVQIRPLKRSPD